jgi:hypothetical protein
MTSLVLRSFLLALKPLENLWRAFPSNDIMSKSVVTVLKAFDCATHVELSVSKEKGKASTTLLQGPHTFQPPGNPELRD